MRAVRALPLVVLFTIGAHRGADTAVAPVAVPNDNRAAAGSYRDGVLTIVLEATRARWYPNGEAMPGREVAAFALIGGKPSVPGALIRVVKGTAIHATIVNSLGDTLVFRIPATIHGAANTAPMDSVIVPPGERRELRVLASAPGNYIYRAGLPDTVSRNLRMTGLLTGAIVVDETASPPMDRVMVVTMSTDSVLGHIIFAINGLAWPHTERLSATVGDTTRWRILNASQDTHPMHLHGFYFRVDDFKVPAPIADPDMNGRMAVTQWMPAFSTLSMSWVPERAGNWLFHCHFQLHLSQPRPLELPPALTSPGVRQGGAHDSHANHAMTGMSGLVMAIAVAERRGARTVVERHVAQRKLRLLAIQDPGFPDSVPSMRFVIEENGVRTDAGPGFSPPLNLKRGEPVSITVVNQTDSATAVHWHGMELESYFDGVAGLSGTAAKLAPMIAPRDSFEARFSSPRAGTFIYHSHADEPRTHRAGMLGAMIVREGSSLPVADEQTFFLKAARARGPVPIDVNGQANPDTVTIRAGRTTRLRFIALTLVNPSAAVVVTSRTDSAMLLSADSMIVPMRLVAKDGADLPESARRMVPTRQVISMGETYDFELSPQRPGRLRLEVRGAGANGRLLARVPLIVR
jgi:manganese oxidase